MLRNDLSYIIAFIVVFGNCTSSVNIKPISPFSDLGEVADFAGIIEPENIIEFESEINDSPTMKLAGVNPAIDPKKPIEAAVPKRPQEIFIESLVNEDEDEEEGTLKGPTKASNQNMGGIRADQLIDIKQQLDAMGRLFAEKTMGHRYLSNSKDHSRTMPNGIAVNVSGHNEHQEQQKMESTEGPFQHDLSTLKTIVQNYLNSEQPGKGTNPGNIKSNAQNYLNNGPPDKEVNPGNVTKNAQNYPRTEQSSNETNSGNVKSNAQYYLNNDPPDKETNPGNVKSIVQNYVNNDEPDIETNSGNGTMCCEDGRNEESQSYGQGHVESNEPKETQAKVLVMHFFKIDPTRDHPQKCAEHIETVCVDDVPSESNSDGASGSDSGACDSDGSSESGSGPAPIDFPEGQNSSCCDSGDSINNNDSATDVTPGDDYSGCDSTESDNIENETENCESTDTISPEPSSSSCSPETTPDNCDDDSDDDGNQAITINLYLNPKCSKHPREVPANYDYIAFLSQKGKMNFLPAQKLVINTDGKRRRRYNLFSESKYQTHSDKADIMKILDGEKLMLRRFSSPILFVNAIRHTLERQKRSMDPKENAYLKEANVLINTLNVSTLTSNSDLDDSGVALGSGTLVNPKYSDDSPASTERSDLDEADGLLQQYGSGGGGSFTGNAAKSPNLDESAGLNSNNDFNAGVEDNAAFGTKELKNDNLASNSLENNFVDRVDSESVGSRKDSQSDFGLASPRHYYFKHLGKAPLAPKPIEISKNNHLNNHFQKNFINVFPSDDASKDRVSFYCDEAESTTQISNATVATTTMAVPLAAPSVDNSSSVLAAANAAGGFANFNLNESSSAISDAGVPTMAELSNFEITTECTTNSNSDKFDKLGVYVVHGADASSKKHHKGSAGHNEEMTDGESDSKENGELLSQEDKGVDDSDSQPNVLDLVSNATTLSPGAVSASSGAVSLSETSIATLATGTTPEGSTANGSSTEPPKSIKSSVLSKLQNLQRDLKLVFEVQNILNGAKKKTSSDSRRKRDTTNREISVKSKRCKHKSTAHFMGGSSNLDSQVRQLGKILKFRQNAEDNSGVEKVTSCDGDEKYAKNKRFLFKKRKNKKKRTKSFWHKIFGSSTAPSHFLDNPQNFH